MRVNAYFRNYRTGETASVKKLENGKAIFTTYDRKTGKRSRKTYSNYKAALTAFYHLQIMEREDKSK